MKKKAIIYKSQLIYTVTGYAMIWFDRSYTRHENSGAFGFFQSTQDFK